MKQRKNTFILRICIMIICAVLLGTFAGCSKRKTKEIEKTALGIDVGRYQGTIDWQLLGQSGIDFAIVRLGYRGSTSGEIEEDANARYNLQEGNKAGIPLGAYFFSTAVTEEEAKEEAAWAATMMAKYSITYPVAYDCEGFQNPESRQFHMTNRERTDVALAFLETIERLGYEGMFYSSKNEMEKFWDIERIENDYKIWVAQYPAEPYPASEASSYPGTHHMWQYTEEGRVLGIDQPVDLNVAYFGYDGIEPAKDPVPAAEVEPDVEAMMTFTTVDELVTAKDETNLRDAPSQDTDSCVMDVLYNGEMAQRIAVSSSGWSKLIFEGNIYYAVSNYLTTELQQQTEAVPETEGDDDSGIIKTQFADANELVTAKELTNLRSIPSSTRTDSEVLFKLKHGEVALCTGISENGWSRILYQDTVCYAVYSYLMPYADTVDFPDENDIAMKFKDIRDKVTPKKELKLRTSPSTDSEKNVFIKVYNGDVLQRIGINKELGWSKVTYHGYTLYCASMHLINTVD